MERNKKITVFVPLGPSDRIHYFNRLPPLYPPPRPPCSLSCRRPLHPKGYRWECKGSRTVLPPGLASVLLLLSSPGAPIRFSLHRCLRPVRKTRPFSILFLINTGYCYVFLRVGVILSPCTLTDNVSITNFSTCTSSQPF